ncbi:hypothetical protein DER45DRAFT_536509 [Fusarium avenaceum]|nr:hypothetical protein DER45DRAFT_536509 [Fusarium avenaceum]
MGCLGTYRQTCGLRIARARIPTTELCGGGGEEERADGPPGGGGQRTWLVVETSLSAPAHNRARKTFRNGSWAEFSPLSRGQPPSQHMLSLNHVSSITNTVISPLGYTAFSPPSGSGCWFRHGSAPFDSMTLWLPPPKRSEWMRSNKVRQITAARRNKVQTCRHRTSKLSPQPVHRWPIMDLQEILLRSFREGICAKEVKLNNTKLQEDKNCQSSDSSKKGYSSHMPQQKQGLIGTVTSKLDPHMNLGTWFPGFRPSLNDDPRFGTIC